VSRLLATAEVYYAAVLSKDPKLQEVFKEGKDFHSSIAAKVFNLPCPVEDVKKYFKDKRQAAKAINKKWLPINPFNCWNTLTSNVEGNQQPRLRILADT